MDGLGHVAEKRARIGRCPPRNHRIVGAAKQPSMRPNFDHRLAEAASESTMAEAVT
jgi:hypothetical protein